jgi:ABC-type dipeptide/oligopeptide/nickel transport system ATPase component
MALDDAGCAFAPRCPQAAPVCSELPALERRGPAGGHLDACWRSNEVPSDITAIKEPLGGAA